MDKPVIAAFDFDGTITSKDILLPFLIFVRGKRAVYLALVCLLTSLFLYLCGKRSRQQVKEALVHSLLNGMPISSLETISEKFREKTFKSLLLKQAESRWAWHRQEGHRLVIVSANFSFLLAGFAKEKGADLICSRLQVDEQGRINGKIEGHNCWGPEKTRRLIEKYGPKDNYVLYAYGDGRGDQELLELADYPHYRYFSH